MLNTTLGCIFLNSCAHLTVIGYKANAPEILIVPSRSSATLVLGSRITYDEAETVTMAVAIDIKNVFLKIVIFILRWLKH